MDRPQWTTVRERMIRARVKYLEKRTWAEHIADGCRGDVEEARLDLLLAEYAVIRAARDMIEADLGEPVTRRGVGLWGKFDQGQATREEVVKLVQASMEYTPTLHL